MMPIENIPDWEKRVARQDAFWNGAILDRPVAIIPYARPEPHLPWPARHHANLRDRWLDAGYAADCALVNAANTVYAGDALPAAYPNLGPEIFSALFGCELEFGESTTWAIPNLHDWSEAGSLRYSKDNFYGKKLLEMTDALLEAGRGRFYTGITDLHTGGDAIAAFRDPLAMNLDMIEAPEQIQALLAKVHKAYVAFYDYYYHKLTAAGQPVTTWAGIVSTRKWYVPSNDFSCMISKAMFDEIFLPGIVEECRFHETSIYHLDGPNALQHLDSLLGIKELNAIQWVYGAGHGRSSDWMHIYKKCQKAGKGLQIWLNTDEIDFFMNNLKPEGLWLGISGVRDGDEARAVLNKISRWK